MGVIRIEDHICDICGQPIEAGSVYTGSLTVGKKGARGIRRTLSLSFHGDCIPTVRTEAVSNGNAPRRRRVAAKVAVS